MLTKLNKLRGRSFDELRVRAQQQFAAFKEARGLSSQTKLPSDKALLALLKENYESVSTLLDRFQERKQPQFFAGLNDRQATVAAVSNRWASSTQAIVARANQIIDGRFDLLGYRNLSFGDPVDWHLDPITQRRSPLVHWSLVDELDSSIGGDQKIVRELSRHQYLVTLGQAYWLTNDERYAQTFASHLSSWMNENPLKLGTHWGSSLEIAFRSIAWLWSFYFFKDSASLSPELFGNALKFLYLNARHIETFLSTYFSPNTHLTGEAVGLYYIGTLLPEFKEANQWREAGRKILLQQLERHVRKDGVYFEQSSYYHRYTTDFYTHFLLLARLNDDELPNTVELRLQALMDHLMYITRPDGTTPLFGDDDGGRLMFFDETSANDFGATLSNGAALFRRSDYKFVARELRQETLWLFGVEEFEELEHLENMAPSKCSVAFPESGYYVMRDGWNADANYLLFDCGDHGTLNCGHSHSDALAIELAAHGRTLLIDPGTYTYTGDKELRDWFRSTAAHNTVTVDGEQSSVVDGPFSWESIAGSSCSAWISHDRFDFVSGLHTGYRRLPDPVDHERSILFLKNDYWILRDTLNGHRPHRAALHFHFESGISPKPAEDRLKDQNFEIAIPGTQGTWSRENAWISHCYGSKEPAVSFVYTTNEVDILTFLMPRESFSIREIEALGGRGFEVVHPDGIDVVMVAHKAGTTVETARLASDFLWTWTRFKGSDDPVPSELVLLSGTSLKLEGRQILKTNRAVEFISACLVGDHFTVASNEGVLNVRLPAADLATVFSQLNDLQIRN